MSLLWKHFTNISSGVAHVNIAFGNIIRKTTASLKYHLSVKHPEKYQPTTSINDESNSDSESEAESGPSTQKRVNKRARLTIPRKEYYSRNDLVEEQILTNSILQNPKSEAITMSLVKMIAVDMLPLSFVEGPGLLQFLHTVCPDYTVPSRTVIRDRLQGLYDAKVSAIVGHFKHSNKATTALENAQKKINLPIHRLISHSPTRWNSAYEMVERLVEQRDAVESVLLDKEITTTEK
ncbi:Zinc finger BED domain-containing protein 6 [Eumeta japonica]|uniref:Zinc finger BED domain-containing protein 6 n=1 Tax=Eumeta variegata TaxID=151549 RepID=A0A4C1WHZ9_EUMVA|nr:Zinc finger BED domain-containing protein 6 [Eumeta japonica]